MIRIFNNYMKSSRKSILICEVSGVWGIKGDVKIRSYTEEPEKIFDYPLHDQNNNPIIITRVHAKAHHFICKINNCDNRNCAEQYIGMKLYVPRHIIPKIPEESFYIVDLVGLNVINSDKEQIGIVKFIHNFGAGNIVEIEFNNKNTELFEFNKTNFPDISTDYIILNQRN